MLLLALQHFSVPFFFLLSFQCRLDQLWDIIQVTSLLSAPVLLIVNMQYQRYKPEDVLK